MAALTTMISIWLKIIGFDTMELFHKITNLEKENFTYQTGRNSEAILTTISSMGKEFSLQNMENRYQVFGKTMYLCS